MDGPKRPIAQVQTLRNSDHRNSQSATGPPRGSIGSMRVERPPFSGFRNVLVPPKSNRVPSRDMPAQLSSVVRRPPTNRVVHTSAASQTVTASEDAQGRGTGYKSWWRPASVPYWTKQQKQEVQNAKSDTEHGSPSLTVMSTGAWALRQAYRAGQFHERSRQNVTNWTQTVQGYMPGNRQVFVDHRHQQSYNPSGTITVYDQLKHWGNRTAMRFSEVVGRKPPLRQQPVTVSSGTRYEDVETTEAADQQRCIWVHDVYNCCYHCAHCTLSFGRCCHAPAVMCYCGRLLVRWLQNSCCSHCC